MSIHTDYSVFATTLLMYMSVLIRGVLEVVYACICNVCTKLCLYCTICVGRGCRLTVL